MEKAIFPSHDWAVRVENASRLFINTAGKPVPAVNCATLGAKKDSIFGFLGANGEGKTALIRMITGTLPVSDGNSEILGQNIDEIDDRTNLLICPQFNTHLCFKMTRENFLLYGLLFEMDDIELQEISPKPMEGTKLFRFFDTPIRDLSAGVRK